MWAAPGWVLHLSFIDCPVPVGLRKLENVDFTSMFDGVSQQNSPMGEKKTPAVKAVKVEETSKRDEGVVFRADVIVTS